MTLKEKYKIINHKKVITDQIAFKINGNRSGRYLRMLINEDKVDEELATYIHKVFDNHLSWMENIEKNHYKNLCK
jgi:hypothetical protein